MGGRGSNGVRNTVSVTEKFRALPESNIKPLKPTQRADEVFSREYTELRLLADKLLANGELDSGGYSTLHKDDNEPVFSQRMLQGMQARVNSEFRGLNIDEQLGVSTPEENVRKRYALTMLQKMMNKYYDDMYRR